MEKQLLGMVGRSIPSSSFSRVYLVTEVVPGRHVTLTAPTRQQPSVLRWEDIELVYSEAPASGLRTIDVDAILGNQQYRHSATMCALVLALQHPERII